MVILSTNTIGQSASGDGTIAAGKLGNFFFFFLRLAKTAKVKGVVDVVVTAFRSSKMVSAV